jgi:O-antigen ligase
MGRNPTLTGRTEIWTTLLNFSGNPVFGTGFDSFWLGDRLRKIWATGSLMNGINEAHNGYIETYLNLGWIGVSLLAALIVTGYRNIIAAFRLDPSIARLKLAFFVVAVVYSFTEVGFRTTCTVWIAFLFAIMAVPKPPVFKRLRPFDKRGFADSTSEAERIMVLPQRDESFVASPSIEASVRIVE